MKMMTKELERKLPALYSQEENDDPLVLVHYFVPWGSWDWYGYEYDPKRRLFFGLVKGIETELGYFSLDELESVRGPLGMRIERDLYFEPRPLSAIQ